jgi:hypothetical protein
VHDAARLFLVAGSVGFAACAVEATHAWLAARRRLALGLADPVVVNRFGLFAGSSYVDLGVLALVASGGRATLQVPLFQATMTVANFAIAGLANATNRPLDESAALKLASFASPPMEPRETRVVSPVWRSWTKTSLRSFPSSGTRFEASEEKAT